MLQNKDKQLTADVKKKQLDKCKLGNLQSNWCKFLSKSHLFEKEDKGSVAQTVKHLSTMRETRVRSLGQEDPLKKEMAIHSSIPAWKIPGTEEPGGLLSMGSHRVRHD